MLANLWEYIINFFEVLLFYFFIDTKLTRKDQFKNKQYLKFIFLVFRFLSVCLLNCLQDTSVLTMLFSCCMEILFALLFYDGYFMLRVFWGLLFSVICLIADYITISIPQISMNLDTETLLQSGQHRIPFTMLYLTLVAVIVFLFHHVSGNKIQLTGKEKLFYIVISFSGMSVGHFIMAVTLESELSFHNSSFTFKLTMINLFFLILFLSLLVYIFQLGKSKATNIQLLENEKIHKLEEIEYKNLITTTESLREMKHDINIHLNVIQSMINHGTKEELLAYIADYNKCLEQTHKFISTGNTAIDCILSSKIDVATKLGISVDFAVLTPSKFPLDSLSTSSLIGNMWNNAIEACQRMNSQGTDKVPYINFYIKPFQDMLIIHMENNYDGYIKHEQNNFYLSTKKDNEHGIGLKRISDIVEKAGGILQINPENNIFIVHIMLPEREVSYNDNENSNS